MNLTSQTLPRATRKRSRVLAWLAPGTVLGACLVSMSALHAQPQSAAADGLKLYLERAATGLPGRVEVVVGQLDERLQLAPCARVEPFLPVISRLWGKTQIGLRCAEGASWSVYLPVQIRVFAPALIATRTIGFGHSVGADDARLEEVEVSREPGAPIADLPSLDGKTAARVIAAGQILRAEHFRTPPAIGAGDTVRLILNGAGFSISASGRALSSAAEGQSVRVQTDSGRVVQGVARSGRLVEMRL